MSCELLVVSGEKEIEKETILTNRKGYDMTPETKCKTCNEHSGVEQQLEEHERRLNKQDGTLNSIFEKLEDISSKLLRRPGWVVCTMLTLLSSLLTASITIILFLAKK